MSFGYRNVYSQSLPNLFNDKVENFTYLKQFLYFINKPKYII